MNSLLKPIKTKHFFTHHLQNNTVCSTGSYLENKVDDGGLRTKHQLSNNQKVAFTTSNAFENAPLHKHRRKKNHFWFFARIYFNFKELLGKL